MGEYDVPEEDLSTEEYTILVGGDFAVGPEEIYLLDAVETEEIFEDHSVEGVDIDINEIPEEYREKVEDILEEWKDTEWAKREGKNTIGLYKTNIKTHSNNHFWMSTGTESTILGVESYDHINVVVLDNPEEFDHPNE